MFSARTDKVGYGVSHYQWRTDISTVINQLFQKYHKEGIAMAYTVEDYRRQRREHLLSTITQEEVCELLEDLPPEEILKVFPSEKILRIVPLEERLRGLPPEERLRGLPPEERLRGLPPEERLRGLSEKDIEVCLKILRQKQQKHSG